MKATTLADTGPLVALLSENDQWHDWALLTLKQLPPPLVSCEAVLTEAWHLLDEVGRNALNKLHTSGVLVIDFSFNAHSPEVWRLLTKYSDLPMDFADACLVRMAEARAEVRVWTTDGDFHIYRQHGRKSIPLVAPDRE